MVLFYAHTISHPEGVVCCAITPLSFSKCQDSWQKVDLPNLALIYYQIFEGTELYSIFYMVKFKYIYL